MFDPLVYLLYVVTALAVFFGTVPLAIAVMLGDRPRIERLMDLYIEVFQASAAAIIGALRIFRRKDSPQELPQRDNKQLPPPNTG